jgi:thioredoxin
LAGLRLGKNRTIFSKHENSLAENSIFKKVMHPEGRQTMPSVIVYALIGGALGAALGYFGKCTTGACRLTTSWWRGALYGAALGGAFYLLSGQGGSAAMNESTHNVKRVGEAAFEAEVMQAKSPVLVDFYATWCGTCRALAPRVDKLAGEFSGQIKFVKVNTDDAPVVAHRFGIEGLPTLLFFKDGKVVDGFAGLPTEDFLRARLNLLAETKPTAGALK